MEDETTRRLPTKEEHRDPFFVLCLISHYYANKIYWRIIEGDRRAVASIRRRRRGARRPAVPSLEGAKKLDPATIFLISDSR